MRYIIFILASVLLLTSVWTGLTLGQVPETELNIIYAHVPSSICALLCFVALVVAGIGYLKTSGESWDRVAIASAEVGMVFAIILNATGSIFSRAWWGPWWDASPRLVSSAILLFLYVAYLILRSSLSGSRQRIGRICAVFSIIAFLDVPMVFISARFMEDIHRPKLEFASPWQWVAFFLGMISISLLAVYFIWLRTSMLKNKDMLEQDLIS